MKQKILSLLVLLVATATGAWADHTVKWEGETLQSVSVLQFGGKVTTVTMTIDGITVTANNGYMKYVDGIDLYSADATGLVFSAEDNIKSIKITSIGESKFTSNSNYVSSGGTKTYTLTSPAISYALEAGVHIKVIKSIEFTLEGDAPVEVTTNVAEGDTCFTQASFAMPYYNTNVEYELVRDMEYKVGAEITEHIRIKMVNNNYQLHNADQLKLVVADTIDAAHPDTLEIGEAKDYVTTLQKKNGDSWVNVTAANWYAVDTFRYVVSGRGLYDGVINSNEFVLYEGYPVKIPAKEFVTYYRDEALGLLDEEYLAGAALYTITAVSDGKATATLLDITNQEPPLTQIAPANTPLLIYNSSDDTLEIKLIPTTTNATVSYYSRFTGVLEPTTLTGDDGFYAFNGKQFVYVRKDLTLPANKCCLKINSNSSGFVSGARAINIVFEEATGISDATRLNDKEQMINDEWYDLQGRRVKSSIQKKGVYINDGNKVIIK